MITSEQKQFFADVADEIVNHEEYQKLKLYTHHLCMTRYEHSMHVAYRAYYKALKCKKDVDYKSIIRGALLHDFYFYQREDAPKDHLKSHPALSLENNLKYFEINDLEKDIILSHMWPVGGPKPKFKESSIVNKSDKVCSIVEVVKIKKKFIENFRTFLEVYKLT